MRMLWFNDYLICKRNVEIEKIYCMKTQVFLLPPSGLKRAFEKIHVSEFSASFLRVKSKVKCMTALAR